MWIQKCLSSRLYSCLHAGTGNSSEECGPRVEVQIELLIWSCVWKMGIGRSSTDGAALKGFNPEGFGVSCDTYKYI